MKFPLLHRLKIPINLLLQKKRKKSADFSDIHCFHLLSELVVDRDPKNGARASPEPLVLFQGLARA
jgi:hypothetical protein